MPSYRQRFAGAVTRTRKWGLAGDEVDLAASFLPQGPTRPSPAREAMEALADDHPWGSVRRRVAACVQVHAATLLHFYKSGAATEPVLTIGELLVHGRPFFGVTREGLQNLLDAGPTAKGTTRWHAWLTWPDLSVVDFAVIPSLLAHGSEEDLQLRLDLERSDTLVLQGRPPDLPAGLDYVPWLVGTEPVWRVGCLDGASEQRFRAARRAYLNDRLASPSPAVIVEGDERGADAATMPSAETSWPTAPTARYSSSASRLRPR